MNRIIKFRAWDKKNLEMRDWKWLSTASYTMQFSLFEDENFVCQQFTGLLDKNGKEIYEGDLLKFSENYVSGAAILSTEVKAMNEVIVIEEVKWVEQRWQPYRLHEGEVIGNLYENNELLDKPPESI